MKKIAFIIHGKVRNKQKIIKEIESTFFGNYKIAFFIVAGIVVVSGIWLINRYLVKTEI